MWVSASEKSLRGERTCLPGQIPSRPRSRRATAMGSILRFRHSQNAFLSVRQRRGSFPRTSRCGSRCLRLFFRNQSGVISGSVPILRIGPLRTRLPSPTGPLICICRITSPEPRIQSVWCPGPESSGARSSLLHLPAGSIPSQRCFRIPGSTGGRSRVAAKRPTRSSGFSGKARARTPSGDDMLVGAAAAVCTLFKNAEGSVSDIAATVALGPLLLRAPVPRSHHPDEYRIPESGASGPVAGVT